MRVRGPALIGLLIVWLVVLAGCAGPSAPPAPPTLAPAARATQPPPAAVPAAPPVQAAPTAAGREMVRVGNTDGQGVYLRSAPQVGERLRAYPDGTPLSLLGPDVESGGTVWRHVRAPDGLEGYVSAAYVVALPAGSADAGAYAAGALPKAQRVVEAIGPVSEQVSRLSGNPLLLGDPVWRSETTRALAVLRAAGEALQQPEPAPPELQRLDGLVVAIGTDLVALSDDATAGLEAGDIGRLLRAAQRLQAVSAKVLEARAEAESLRARYGL